MFAPHLERSISTHIKENISISAILDIIANESRGDRLESVIEWPDWLIQNRTKRFDAPRRHAQSTRVEEWTENRPLPCCQLLQVCNSDLFPKKSFSRNVGCKRPALARARRARPHISWKNFFRKQVWIANLQELTTRERAAFGSFFNDMMVLRFQWPYTI